MNNSSNIKYINNNIYNNPNKSKCKKLCEVIPLFIKTITLITITLYVINTFVFNISFYLSNVPFYSLYKYQIWRLFSTSLMNTSIINIVLSLVLWIKFGSLLEDTTGTLLYLFIFIINSSFIQILYTILIFIFSLVVKNKNILSLKIDNNGIVNNCGIWPYIASEITLLSLSNPNEIIKLFFFPEIKAKFYPIIVFLVFGLCNNLIIDFEVFCGILYAFIYHFLIKNILKISKDFIKKLENTRCVKCFMKFGGFISIKKKRFYTSQDNYDKNKIRNVIINNTLPNIDQFSSDTNVNVKEIDSSIIDDKNKKSMNDTLDIKLENKIN